MIIDLLHQAGLPEGVVNIVNGGKDAVDAILTHPNIKAVSLWAQPPLRNMSIPQEQPMVSASRWAGPRTIWSLCLMRIWIAVDALMGAGYGSTGERCMAISVAVPVGQDTADRLVEKLAPRVIRSGWPMG